MWNISLWDSYRILRKNLELFSLREDDGWVVLLGEYDEFGFECVVCDVYRILWLTG